MKKLMNKQKDGFWGHIIYKPEELTNDMPLIVYLHGAGERGTNLNNVERHGIPYLITNENPDIPAVV